MIANEELSVTVKANLLDAVEFKKLAKPICLTGIPIRHKGIHSIITTSTE